MKIRIIILFTVSAFILSACMAMMDPVLVNDCNRFANEQHRTQEWRNACAMGNNNLVLDGYALHTERMSDDEICQDVRMFYSMPYGNIAQQVANQKKLNCDKWIMQNSQLSVTPPQTLCSVWYRRDAHPATIQAVDNEVARRGLDCVGLINGVQQQALMQQQMQNAANQARMNQQIATNPTYQRPIQTTCNQVAGQVNCISQPTGLDIGVLNRLHH